MFYVGQDPMLQKQLQISENSKHESKKSKVPSDRKMTLDDRVAEINAQQRDEDDRVRELEESSPQESLIDANVREQESEPTK